MIPKNNDIRFEITTHCNYNCVICPRDKFCRPKTTMPTKLFSTCLEKIQDATNQYTIVSMAGFGEPLMDKDFLDKVEIAYKKGFEQTLTTNASLLTVEKFLRMQEMGMRTIKVSFYGMTPQSYSAVHGIDRDSPRFEKLLDTLNEICALQKQTRLALIFNVTQGYNDKDLEPWLDYWKDKAALVEAWKPHNWVYGRNLRAVAAEKRKTCGRPFSGPLQVQVDGTVNMCCFDFNGDLFLGDLKTQTLDEIFAKDAFKNLCAQHSSGVYNDKVICANCDQRNLHKESFLVYSNSGLEAKKRVEVTSTAYSRLNGGQ